MVGIGIDRADAIPRGLKIGARGGEQSRAREPLVERDLE
jgi:hypothetical protein